MNICFAFVSTKTVLRLYSLKTTTKLRLFCYAKIPHKPKAPSVRELPTKSGEGERATIKLQQI